MVAQKALELSERFGAKSDLAVAGALLHDFGDAFTDRFATDHEAKTLQKGQEVLELAGYSPEEITTIFNEIIAPHSCKDGLLPTTREGQVLATADALAHLTTDFYLQFAWLHLPEGKNFQEYKTWVCTKLDRDFSQKIFFNEIKEEVRPRFNALQSLFSL